MIKLSEFHVNPIPKGELKIVRVIRGCDTELILVGEDGKLYHTRKAYHFPLSFWAAATLTALAAAKIISRVELKEWRDRTKAKAAKYQRDESITSFKNGAAALGLKLTAQQLKQIEQ